MTESLFVLLTVASFYAAKREHWWAAGLIGLCASATRVTGVLLLPSLLVLSWQMYRSLPDQKDRRVTADPVWSFRIHVLFVVAERRRVGVQACE
jgi:hypothetical protein